MNKTLFRDSTHKLFGGVASGLADYWNIDITIVRVLFILAFFLHHGFTSISIFIYIFFWVILPERNPEIKTQNDPSLEVNYIVNEPGQAQSFSNPSPLGPDPKKNTPNYEERNKIIGIILVVIGALFFFEENFNWDFIWVDRFWPFGLVAIGIYLLASGKKNQNPSPKL